MSEEVISEGKERDISSPLMGEDEGEGDVAPHPNLLPRGEKEKLYICSKGFV